MKIREATREDYDKLVEFWNSNAGWDVITREVWEERFIRAPYGPSVVVIGESDGRIIAMLIFIRLKATLGNETVSGCRPFASVIHNSVKGLMGFKHIISVLNFGIRLMREKGHDLLVMIPDPRWKAIARFIDLAYYDFPLYKRAINNHQNEIRDSIVTRTIDFDHPGIDNLWLDVKAQNLYMIVREKEILKWKNSHRDYKIVGVFQAEQLIGVATYLEKAQDKQIQICDLLYSHGDVKKTVLLGVSDFISQSYLNDTRFHKMVILVTEALKQCLLEIGYVPDDYQFLFVIKRLNKNIPKKALNISNWYISAND